MQVDCLEEFIMLVLRLPNKFQTKRTIGFLRLTPAVWFFRRPIQINMIIEGYKDLTSS